MSAAFELSRPEHEGRYEVTVYQLGWRLGGKGASGRGAAARAGRDLTELGLTSRVFLFVPEHLKETLSAPQ